MSEELLGKLLLGQVDVVVISQWLRQEKLNVSSYDYIKCEPQDFAVRFTDYLRDATSRYVQAVPNNTLKKDVLSVSNILHTSTPKRRPNRSLPINDTIQDSNNRSFKYSKGHRSFNNNTCPTLENFISDSLLQQSKENLSLNQKSKKKKKNSRLTISPTLQENKSVNFEKNISEPQLNKSIEQKYSRSLEPRRINLGKIPDSNNVAKSRRIKPTVLLEQSQKITVVGSNSFSFAQSSEEIVDNVSVWQRNILRDEKEKIAARTADTTITVRRNLTRNIISVTFNDVTKIKHLDSLVHIYKTLLDYGYILSLATELHFILTLLLANGQEGVYSSQNFHEDVFDSIHNCVYFAAKVLLSQASFLCMLNRSTLRLLCDNNRIQEFVPELPNILAPFIIHRKVEISFVSQNEDLHVATYLPETDSRDYFPTDTSFHAFRRQRDAFYDILRYWQTSKGRPGWNFAASLGGKIRTLLATHPHPANYHHLAKLVTRQILASSSYDGELDNSENLDKNLPNVSSEKLNKLKNRLVTRDIESECSQFPNRQEFYMEFITCTAYTNSLFINHMIDSLIDTILTMEDGFDAERPDSAESTFTDNNYITFLKSSRLLAKFLGYIVALPYTGEIKDGTLKTLQNVRRHCQPPIDIKSRLKYSLTTGRILITIPWLVEYLINLDTVSLCLPIYESVIKILLLINNGTKGKFTSAAYFVRLCLGRLFQSECFPRSMFYESLKINCDKEEVILIDDIGEIAEEAFYECVPSLAALKKVLSSGQSSVCVRSIRPVTTTIVSGQKAQSERDQKQLEEVFFHGQPESVRRSVNFVSERISSAILKTLKRIHIESSIQDALNIFLNYIEINHKEKEESYENFVKEAILKAKEISENSLKNLKSKFNKDAARLANQRAEKAIPSLLPDDVHPQVIAVCVTVAANKATERISKWIEQTLNTSQFMDPLTKELGKMEDETKNKNHVYITQYETLQEFSIVKLLSNNKQLILTAHETPDQLTIDGIEKTFLYTKNTVTARNDVNATLRDTIKAQVVDMIIALVMNRADLSKDYIPQVVDCLETLCNITESKKQKRPKDKVVNIINARNVQLIDEGPGGKKSWTAFCNLIILLLKKKVLLPNAFEYQVLKLFSSNFSDETFKTVARSLQIIVEDCGFADTEIMKVASCLTAYLVEEL